MKDDPLSRASRYALALGMVILAVTVRILLDPWLGDRFPFLTLLAAIVVTARYCGTGPTLAAIAVGSVAVAYLVIPPRFTFQIDGLEYRVGMALFILIGLGSLYLFRTLHQARAAEQLQREWLLATFASMGDGVIITDAEGRVTLLNPVARKLTGWTAEEARGVPLEQVFRIINEATRHPVDNPALRALREGMVVGLANHTILTSRDGTEWPLDDTAAPIRDEQGRVHGAVLVFREVLEKRTNELRLRDSDRMFRTLADSIPQLAWMTRPDGYIEWYNKRWYEYTVTTPEQMEGWGWQSVHDPAELPRVLKNWKAALAAGTPWEDTFPLRRHDGQMRWHLSRAVPVLDNQGKILHWFGTNTDITERMQIELELEAADRRKDEFLAILAHELRNPMAALRNALEIIRLVGDEGKVVEESRALMVRQLDQMVRLVDDLTDISRIRREKLRLKKERVELAPVIRTAVETSRALIDEAGHRLTVDLPEEPILLEADANRLAQVFSNLLSNAAKYTERGGEISLTVRREGPEAVVSVRDTGVGIPADQLPHIFEMFAQVDQSLERSRGGLGIGLTLVRRLAELHGGSVEARSEGAGKGSEFLVRLPVLEEARTLTHEQRPLRDGKAGGPGKGRVLLVDDNRDAAVSLATVLKAGGYEVRVAYDGEEGVATAERFRPQVVLLDISLPKLNGYAVARRLRAQPGGKEMVLIATTGWGQDDDRRRSFEAGFDHHMVKPIDPAALQNLLTESAPALA
jgi:PAS domain S-box-containing protein